jgi:hypothetical protein
MLKEKRLPIGLYAPGLVFVKECENKLISQIFFIIFSKVGQEILLYKGKSIHNSYF